MAFGKPQKENPAPANPKKLEPYDIHVMPSKFHQYLSVKSKGSPSKLLMVIALVVFVLTFLGIGGYFLYLQMNLPDQNINEVNRPAVLNENLNLDNENLNLDLENINAEEDLNVNDNLNAVENENINLNDNLNGNINAGLNDNVNDNENINGNSNINAPVEANIYTSSVDSDNDNLTDVEEDLYQTEKRKPDTDEDGYIDGDEIINGYNPKAAGGARLETSGLVNKYSNPVFDYEILYPTSWLARPEDQSLTVVLFMTATQEFIRVAVEDNPDRLDIVTWYLRLSPGADLDPLEKINTPVGYEALVSSDKLTYYILDPNTRDKVYVINYNIDALAQINFLSTFQLMVNLFTLNLPVE